MPDISLNTETLTLAIIGLFTGLVFLKASYNLILKTSKSAKTGAL